MCPIYRESRKSIRINKEDMNDIQDRMIKKKKLWTPIVAPHAPWITYNPDQLNKVIPRYENLGSSESDLMSGKIKKIV